MVTGIKKRYLTKTRFKLAVECPTKLFYTGKSTAYSDTKQEDDFLKALAEGGFQVGELAKLMFPDGIEVKSVNHDEALAETQALLSREKVTIFEAAVMHENLFIRVDVLRKLGNQVELIEVKAKSFRSTDINAFRNKSGAIDKAMLPYLQDVAFQRHVMSQAHPNWTIQGFLMMADKSKTATVDGLNQCFKINRQNDGRTRVDVVPGTSLATIGEPILTQVNVDEYVDEILACAVLAPGFSASLMDLTKDWAQKYEQDEKIAPTIGAQCGKCEFRTAANPSGLKSGFNECLFEAFGLNEAQINAGTVLDIWKFKSKQKLIDKKTILFDQVQKADLNYKEADEGLSDLQRQWMQVSKEWPGGGEFYLDKGLLASEKANWNFPLHFIDFETARVAIPFFKGQRPYDNIAFQFSHHEMSKEGVVVHKSEYLCTTPGVKPNYEFVRQLKLAVGDTGTVFMWWPHENTTLNAILEELGNDPAPPDDAKEIEQTILDLTMVRSNGKVVRKGQRAMVDLCTLSSKVFFHPLTKASSSIKKVLPAVMQSSAYLKARYSQPIYGSAGGVQSKNFKDHIWWRKGSNGPESPYKLLPAVFTDLPDEVLENLDSTDDMEIAEGGAATTAYARLQFDTLSASERNHIASALLRYCELDTMAMVMIYEAWREWL